MTGAQTRFDLYSRTISNAAVREFDAEPDPVKRFRKYACSITSSEQAAIEARTREVEAGEAGRSQTVLLDSDVVDHFRKAGGDWQQRINDVLRASIERN